MATTAGGLAVGGDVEQALAGIPVPSYVLDTNGVVRWLNPAAERLLGNVRGRHFTDGGRARGPDAGKRALRAQGAWRRLRDRDDRRPGLDRRETASRVEISAVPLVGGDRVVGVFGLLTGPPRRSRARRLRI